jgi:antitoxin component YwqK of YwqJK toxin-antitoxin module
VRGRKWWNWCKDHHPTKTPTPLFSCYNRRMNRIFGPIFALVLLFPSLALGNPVEWGDLVEREGLIYKWFTNVPFTGEVTGQEQGPFKDGVKDGPWVEYWENGRLKRKGDYTDGDLDGPWVYYHDNGQLWTKGDLKDGELDGPWVEYHENGQLWSERDWKDGKIDGPWVEYYDNGQLRSEGDYKDGEKDGPWVYYHELGQLWRKGDYKDGEREGPWVVFNKDGSKRFEPEKLGERVLDEGSGTYRNGEKVSDY